MTNEENTTIENLTVENLTVENLDVADCIETLAEEDLSAGIEALLFASGEPLTADRIARLIGIPKKETVLFIEDLSRKLSRDSSGLELIEVNHGYQLRTKQKFGPHIRALRAEKPRRLTSSALETLAIVAYRQPVVKSDIETLRGVDSTPTIKTLLERGLIQIIGHQPTAGSPALYGTTEDFLKIFGLKSLSALPTLKDIRMFDNEPGENEQSDNE